MPYFVGGRSGWPLPTHVTVHAPGHWLVRVTNYLMYRCTAAIVDGDIVFTNAAAGGLALVMDSPLECVPIDSDGNACWAAVEAEAAAQWAANEEIPDDIADVFGTADGAGAHNDVIIPDLNDVVAMQASSAGVWTPKWPLHTNGQTFSTWTSMTAELRKYAASLRVIVADANTEATWTGQRLIKASRYSAGLRLMSLRVPNVLRVTTADAPNLASWHVGGPVVMTSVSNGSMKLTPASQTGASALAKVLAQIDAMTLDWWEA